MKDLAFLILVTVLPSFMNIKGPFSILPPPAII